MNTTTTGVLTGVLAYAGRWSEGKDLDIKVAIGTAGAILFLSVITQANEHLGQQLGALILVGAIFRYMPSIATKLGLANG